MTLQLRVGDSAGTSGQGGVIGRRRMVLFFDGLVQAVWHCPELHLFIRSMVAHSQFRHPVGLQAVGQQSM